MNAIDLFCGCGGASLGLELAGYQVVAAVDNDLVACKTYARNLGLAPICRDLRFFSGEQILESCDLKRGDVDLVVGCPPCQGFSSLRRTRYPDCRDSRKSLVTVFLKRIAEIRPKAAILENVPGIATSKGLRYLNKFLRQIEKAGYKTDWKLVNAADYGIAQFRRRVIAVCAQGEIKPSIPARTHADPNEALDGMKPWKTVYDEIRQLPSLEPGECCSSIPNHRARTHSPRVLDIIRNIPKDGGSRKSLPEHLWLPCHRKLREDKGHGAESIYGRMTWKKPSPTITCRCTTPSSGRFVHPEQDRAITPREAARLQSFPDGFVFPQEFNKAERLIGNAVPPTLMSVLSSSFEEVF
jgi:DNA (cytosine-5)-methyltransferase 1